MLQFPLHFLKKRKQQQQQQQQQQQRQETRSVPAQSRALSIKPLAGARSQSHDFEYFENMKCFVKNFESRKSIKSYAMHNHSYETSLADLSYGTIYLFTFSR